MDADQRWHEVNIAHDERYQAFDSFAMLGRFFAAGARLRQMAFKAEDAEVSPAGGEIGVGYLYDLFKTHNLFYGLWRIGCRRRQGDSERAWARAR